MKTNLHTTPAPGRHWAPSPARTAILLSAVLAFAPSVAAAAEILLVDFGRPGDPVMSGFTAVTTFAPTPVGAYTVQAFSTPSGWSDFYNWGGGGSDALTTDAVYDNSSYLTGYVTVDISGLSPGSYDLKVWCVESATAGGVYYVNPSGTTTGSSLAITNAGTADSADPSTYGIGTYTSTDGTLEFRVTGQNNFGPAPNSARVNGFTLTPVPEPSTPILLASGLLGLLAYRKRKS
ncbi:MAG: PEP-CTERM sorting domain-containing protein [Verrucomicrobia bacterium]|nr:PEP-CTERM sorting domain-containing protein [Verrucomicrobiota bacterium]